MSKVPKKISPDRPRWCRWCNKQLTYEFQARFCSKPCVSRWWFNEYANDQSIPRMTHKPRTELSCCICGQKFTGISSRERFCQACCPTKHDRTRAVQYGISRLQYEALLLRSGGLCEICKRPPKRATKHTNGLTIDHDHVTQRVRGLLCQTCNYTLGMIEKHPRYIERLNDYVRNPFMTWDPPPKTRASLKLKRGDEDAA